MIRTRRQFQTRPTRERGLEVFRSQSPRSRVGLVFWSISISRFVADAARVRQQTPAMSHADAGSVRHDDANLEVLIVKRHSWRSRSLTS